MMEAPIRSAMQKIHSETRRNINICDSRERTSAERSVLNPNTSNHWLAPFAEYVGYLSRNRNIHLTNPSKAGVHAMLLLLPPRNEPTPRDQF